MSKHGVVTTGLTPQEREHFEEARRRGFLVDRSRSRVALSNSWWLHCEEAGRPYVVVRRAGRKGSRATVTVDLGPIGAVFSAKTIEKLAAMFHEHAQPGSAFFPGRYRAAIYGLPTAIVEGLAPLIYRLALREAVLAETCA